MSLWCCLELLVGTIPQKVVFITLVWRCLLIMCQWVVVSFRAEGWREATFSRYVCPSRLGLPELTL
jgi:hypothetical protein